MRKLQKKSGKADKPPGLESKARMGLVNYVWVAGVARVLGKSAKIGKYTDFGWMKSPHNWSKDFDACMRHLTCWYHTGALDPESNESHLLHASCRLMMLYIREKLGVGIDDRPLDGVDGFQKD